LAARRTKFAADIEKLVTYTIKFVADTALEATYTMLEAADTEMFADDTRFKAVFTVLNVARTARIIALTTRFKRLFAFT
jgi:hypothetical protein